MTPFGRTLARSLRFLSSAAVAAVVAATFVAIGGSAQAATADNPVGALDLLRLEPGVGLHAKGWALDRNASGPIAVGVYSDGAFLVQWTANKAQNANHGFDATLQRPPGTHVICIRAINVGLGVNTELGCKSLAFGVSPRGRVESLVQAPGGIKVSGWALDPDVRDPIGIDVYADGTLLSHVLANGVRTDIATAYPAFGSSHGFSASMPVPQGQHNVCVNAVNVAAGSPTTTLACRTVSLNYEPRGGLDAVRQVPNGVSVSGWAIDPDTSASIRVHVYLDGKAVNSVLANLSRPDLASTYPAAGAMHGYTASVGAPAGAHQVCTYAINVLAGAANPRIACKNVTLNFAPFGVFESVQRTSATRVFVAGWAVDPDTASPIKVAVSLDGKVVVTARANVVRPDIAKARHIGVRHGFRIAIPDNGREHSVCVRAINVIAGTSNKVLGCRTVVSAHPVAPAAPHATARAGYGNATVSWTPSSDGGAPPRYYTIRANSGGKYRVVNSAARHAVMLGLRAGGRYYFTVTATNLAGTSLPGRSNVIVTPRDPPPQTTPPPISTSRYLRNINGTSTDIAKMRAAGAADAIHNPGGHRYLILLDIGGQTTSGVVLSATSRYVSNGGLVTALNAYVDGYASGRRPGAPVVIALGTNNDMTVTTSTGLIWARNVVNPVVRHAARYSGMSIAGANDYEPGFTANAAQSRAWLNGYLHGTTRPFVFNGSADGCNWTRVSGGCNNGWRASDLYWLSGGAAPSRIVGLPQIYNQTMAQQWKYISLTGIASKRHKINFGGPLTEWTACHQAGSCGSMTGPTAWRALWKAVRSDARISQGSLPYSTDLRIN